MEEGYQVIAKQKSELADERIYEVLSILWTVGGVRLARNETNLKFTSAFILEKVNLNYNNVWDTAAGMRTYMNIGFLSVPCPYQNNFLCAETLLQNWYLQVVFLIFFPQQFSFLNLLIKPVYDNIRAFSAVHFTVSKGTVFHLDAQPWRP